MRFLLVLLLTCPLYLFATIGIDFENGVAFSGYNDVRIPGDTGTKFSLYNEIKTDAGYFFRIRSNWSFKEKHKISLLIAPLILNGKGSIDRDIRFMDTIFPKDTELKSKYRFDSYRVSYQYGFIDKPSFKFGAGITGKIRDAAITIESSDKSVEKKNTGFVPLLNFSLQYNFIKQLTLLFEGDALAAKVGRAEDVFLGLKHVIGKGFKIKAGYRLLEGGADVKEVYTFALINYASLGIIAEF